MTETPGTILSAIERALAFSTANYPTQFGTKGSIHKNIRDVIVGHLRQMVDERHIEESEAAYLSHKLGLGNFLE